MKKQVYNPYLPSYEYIPDGEPYVFGERLYVYGSHDRFNSNCYCENDYVCWSAPLADLSDWRYEGVIFRVVDHPEDDKHKRSYLYAPDMIQGQDGRYYLYYSMCGSSIMSVAVCDTPAGKYEYYGDVQDKNGRIVGYDAGDFYQFDPSIFRDDDGRLYLYSGFSTKQEVDNEGRIHVSHVCELAQDMITVIDGPKVLIPREAMAEIGARYFEAPSMRKINGIYYFVYSAKNTGLYYYYGNHPDKELVFGGRIHSGADVGINGHSEEYPAYELGNTHGGIVELNGQYYIFDHRHSNNSPFCRQGVAEPIYFDEKGLIGQAECTSCGLNGGPLRSYGVYPAYIACNLFYKEREASKTAFITQDGEDRECEPGQYLKDVNNACVIGYKYFAGNAVNSIKLTVRGNATGRLAVTTEEEGVPVAEAEWKIASEEWTQVEIPVAISGEKFALFFSYEGEGCWDMLEFELA